MSRRHAACAQASPQSGAHIEQTMSKVNVIYNGWGERWPLGVLAEFGHRLLFEYSPEALHQELEDQRLDQLNLLR